ncbi:hypothetical protein AB1L07_02390 [Niallia alba]|uniref:hypothetical protein n=1 Tax=Niallia alba TaxID=2729105 RepID=UPI002E204EE4|nr:hypothetical protein [Niallia alba]
MSRKSQTDVSSYNLIEWVKEISNHNNVEVMRKNLSIFQKIVKILENRVNKLERLEERRYVSR